MGIVRSGQTAMAAAAAALLLAVTGCSGDSGASPPASSGTASGASTATASASLPVLASRDASVKELPVRVDINELRVEGQVTRLTFTARNLAPVVAGQTSDRWQIGTFFNDGVTQTKSGGAPDDAFSVDGVYLLDSAGAKRYLAARNAAHGCVCSGDLSNTFVSPASGVVLTTLFAALPADVDSVDVDVPGFGSFNGVKVSR